MTRRMRLLARFGLLGILGAIVFPGAGSALAPTYVVSLTSSGPSPTVLTTPASAGSIWFHNTDSVSHTVSFANGWCTTAEPDIAPDEGLYCNHPLYVGHYGYTVDGATQADVVIEPADRRVSLRAKHHAVHPGSRVTLHGRLVESNLGGPPGPGSPQRIIVVARPSRSHPHFRIGTVMATVHPPTKRSPFGYLRWQLRIRPRAGMTYMAIASYQPSGGQIWERAVSKPLRINVRHQR